MRDRLLIFALLVGIVIPLWIIAACAAFYDFEAYTNQQPLPQSGVLMIPAPSDGARG